MMTTLRVVLFWLLVVIMIFPLICFFSVVLGVLTSFALIAVLIKETIVQGNERVKVLRNCNATV